MMDRDVEYGTKGDRCDGFGTTQLDAIAEAVSVREVRSAKPVCCSIGQEVAT